MLYCSTPVFHAPPNRHADFQKYARNAPNTANTPSGMYGTARNATDVNGPGAPEVRVMPVFDHPPTPVGDLRPEKPHVSRSGENNKRPALHEERRALRQILRFPRRRCRPGVAADFTVPATPVWAAAAVAPAPVPPAT
ncbi:hypothetical protein Acor_58300 [Acrocarpospora corrugata]|uniref:Uncharacterized protein n=1 Tax=Acrocarpospora corrugata TaxID=35763 RepID=A0A5M3W4S1_9ACTN|nr:hypothetical protein Acor_58300 [Acrocarpospora corrugata]